MKTSDEGKRALKMNNDMEGISKGGILPKKLVGGRAQRGIEIKSEPIAQIYK